MEEKHRKAIRLQDYNYSLPGGYFLTLCTYNRTNLLGGIIDGKIKLTGTGEIVKTWWLKLRSRFSHIELDSYIIMPNHFHGIVIIADVGAIHELPLQNLRIDRRRMILPKVVGYFKMNSAKEVNRLRSNPSTPLWQRNYYEHIIRNEKELDRIREYISNNPMKWELDRENPFSKDFNSPHDLYWKEIYDPVGAIHACTPE